MPVAPRPPRKVWIRTHGRAHNEEIRHDPQRAQERRTRLPAPTPRPLHRSPPRGPPAGTLGDNDPHRGVPSPDRRLLDALQIADPATHSPKTAWHQHAADRDLTLPIATAIDEPTTAATLHLDAANSVIALLAIPGTGKTAALRTITLALCASYPPERVTFACAGGKWGFLHGITELPHLAVHCFDTWDNRDDVHPDVAKWCAYIDDEIDRRTTTTHAGLEPELVIVVDDLDEFLEPNPTAATTVQRIIDRGRHLGIRLIVSMKQLHDTDGDLWTVPALGPAVRFRPDTVIAFSTFRREESMAALGHPGAWSLQRGQGHAYIRPTTELGDTPAHILTVNSDDAATLSAQIAAYQQKGHIPAPSAPARSAPTRRQQLRP